MPPETPRASSPPEVVAVSTGSILLVGGVLLATTSFGLVAYFVLCMRHGVRKAMRTSFQAAPTSAVPLARIAPDGTSSIVHGYLIGSGLMEVSAPDAPRRSVHAKRGVSERQALLADSSGF